MNRLSRTEHLLLSALYSQEDGAGGQSLLEMDLELKEKDAINRIRELVSHIEKLEKEGLLETEPGFYDESDHLSFTYLNSATGLHEERIRLSEQGRMLVSGVPANPGKLGGTLGELWDDRNRRRAVVILCVLCFAAGLLAGYLAGRGI